MQKFKVTYMYCRDGIADKQTTSETIWAFDEHAARNKFWDLHPKALRIISCSKF